VAEYPLMYIGGGLIGLLLVILLIVLILRNF
jgi:hypothetical protein